MCTVYGYCRVSTAKQSIERQIRNIKALYPDAVIIQDVYTRTSLDRPEWKKLYSKSKSGDTIIFDSVSRMSGDAAEGYAAYEDLFNRGVSLVFLKEPHINTDTYKQAMERQLNTAANSGDKDTDELINGIAEAINHYTMRLAERQIKLAFEQSEKEVQDLHQRTKEGIETARLNGKQIGAVPGRKLTTKKSKQAKEIIRKHSKDFNGTLDDAEVIKLADVSRVTYYKYKRELREEDARDEAFLRGEWKHAIPAENKAERERILKKRRTSK